MFSIYKQRSLHSISSFRTFRALPTLSIYLSIYTISVTKDDFLWPSVWVKNSLTFGHKTFRIKLFLIFGNNHTLYFTFSYEPF